MITTLNWKRGLFKCAYLLFSGDKQVGSFKENPWTIRSATGQLNSRVLQFKVKGAFNQTAEIVDQTDAKVIGRVRFNCWWPKANIQIGEKRYEWAFKNVWSTKWQIKGLDSEDEILYKGPAWKGLIDTSSSNSDALLLTGLFIANFYWQLLAIYIACFTPFWIFWL